MGERGELLLGERVHRGVVSGRDVVVHRRERQVGTADRPAGNPQRLERLRRRDLVDEVQIDVQQVGLPLHTLRDVARPDLVQEGETHASTLARLLELSK